MATVRSIFTQEVVVMDNADVVAAMGLPATASLQEVVYDQNTGKLSLVFSQPQ